MATRRYSSEELQIAMAVQCAKCGASPRRGCHNGYGTSTHRSYVHLVRLTDGLKQHIKEQEGRMST